MELSTPGCFYGKLDIKDCFLSFDIHADSRRLLALELGGDHYRFRRMPFGWASSRFWCDRFLSVVDWALEQQGVRFVRYCDDYCVIGRTREEAQSFMEAVQRALEAHGFVIN